MAPRSSFIIDDRYVGPEHPPLVIAEAGVNHNGDLNLAKQLVLEAKRIGAHAIKFQTFVAEKLVSGSTKTVKYQHTSTGEPYQLPMLKRLELSYHNHEELRDYCREHEIIFLSTPTSKSDIDLLFDLDIAAFKIASPDIVSLPFLDYISKKERPVILSTGMSNFAEIEDAINLISQNSENIAIMQCTSSYPCDLPFINLNVISSLHKYRIPVGFSDHSLGLGCAITSILLGACIVEKHFTLSKKLEGPDHSMSLEPNEFELLIRGIEMAYEKRGKDRKDTINLIDQFDPYVAKNLDIALGSHDKQLCPPELEIMNKTRKGIVTSKFIPKNTKIPEDVFSVWEDFFLFKRPNNGLPPKILYKLLGKVANRDLERDELVSMSNFS